MPGMNHSGLEAGKFSAMISHKTLQGGVVCIVVMMTHHTSRVGAEGEIDVAVRDRNCGSGGGAPRNPVRRPRVFGRAVVAVLAVQAVGELVHVGLRLQAGSSSQGCLQRGDYHDLLAKGFTMSTGMQLCHIIHTSRFTHVLMHIWRAIRFED